VVGGTFGFLAFGAFFLAFAIKVPMFPFHTWLPDAHVVGTHGGVGDPGRVLLKRAATGSSGSRCRCSRRRPDLGAGVHRARLIAIIYGAFGAWSSLPQKLVAYSRSATWAS